jgi:hypothetical protein
MSEYVQHITLCDRCRAGEQGEGLPFYPYISLIDRDTGNSSIVRLALPGIFWGGADLAMELGWKEYDYGHACPDCVHLEEEEDAFNNGNGTVSGAIHESQLPGYEDDPPFDALMPKEGYDESDDMGT